MYKVTKVSFKDSSEDLSKIKQEIDKSDTLFLTDTGWPREPSYAAKEAAAYAEKQGKNVAWID